MEYLNGGEMYNAVRKELKSQLKLILFYLVELAIVIEYLHSKNIVHRDVKPDNILIDKNGHIKLIDMGLSKQLVHNRTSTICGTPGYIAPEQLMKKGKLWYNDRVWKRSRFMGIWNHCIRITNWI